MSKVRGWIEKVEQEKIESFTLQDLFFYLFREYKKQWDWLAAAEVPPELSASYIGFMPVETQKERYHPKKKPS